MENQLIETDAVRQALSGSGWSYEDELTELQPESNTLMIPRVVISHDDRGHHKMFIDLGSNYLQEGNEEVPITGNKLTGIIFAHQKIRALWKKDEVQPTCSSIDGTPVSSEPVNDHCAGCPEAIIGPGQCKVKQRLLLLVELEGKLSPVILALPPTSLKHFEKHLIKMQRSQLPLVIGRTRFSLIDIKRNGYRYAEIGITLDGLTDKKTLLQAKQARIDYEKFTSVISSEDYSDAGDKQTG
ncbi:MAG: hypothetical protein HOB84_02575 [Candidatus Marinimicrobia bacterium]|jgi:hypothetical protein|nr:hypothetical protein [Candidatus Neomarinimicrobiota bacterium]MBT6229511.1 hypothetical protein [Candidatus Scalindua sp.]MBT4713641.1 hypothetical protein [Candidatus Neomarinimicrobiota bacterium]MBT4992470.1 hypothetical protein [Candidatus Neomarinimicrobiota bacterium]MBT5269925.1 hypothetical protein [Candidatus Neomarinimicrobiota bacterium]